MGQQISLLQRRRRTRRATAAGLAGALFLLTALAAFAQGDRIEKIVWEGLRRIPRDTMNARILSKEGDPYDPNILKRDFQAVWNTNFFEDVRLEVEDGQTGKIIYFIVRERALIRRITYEGIQSVTQSEILEAFRQMRVGLSVQMQYDPPRIRRAELVLKGLLASRGRHFAKVGHTTRRVPPNGVILTFLVEEGPKVKVGKVDFLGNRRFSDGKLLRTMKGSRPFGVPYLFPLLSKTYNANKVQEDLERIRELYQEQGYFRVVVHPPETETRDTNPFFPLGTVMPWWFKPGKAVDLRIAIDEGLRYRMGELTVESVTGDPNDLYFPAEFLTRAFPLKQGEIFNITKVREALENYSKLYAGFGFINMTVIPATDIDDNNRVIDITLEFESNKQFFVRRIDFVGNTTTRDKVIRRQLLLDEGSIFNGRLWEFSVQRLNQLGYFEELTPDSAEVQQNAAAGTVDLSLKVRERGKNSIGLSGGASGVLGSFLGLNYSTNNFLGLGESLSFDAQFGDRTQSFMFGFTEPFLFDRPIQAGFTFFLRRFEFDQSRERQLLTGVRSQVSPAAQQGLLNFNQDTIGFSLFASYPLRRWRFTRVGLTYSYDDTDIVCLTTGCTDLFEGLQFRSFAGPAALDGIRSSRVTPSFLYNSVNHPLFPTRGTSFFLSTTFEGGPLGGNQQTFRPRFEIKHFRPVNHRRNTLAFRLLGGFVTGFGGQVPSPFNRFYIGGEDTVRGFNIRAISPVAFVPTRIAVPVVFLDPTRLRPDGSPSIRLTFAEALVQQVRLPGGDAELVANAEYRIPLVGPVSISPFFDAGLSTILRPSQLKLTRENLAQLRADFPGAQIPDTLQLAKGTNSRVRSSVGIEWVVQVPIVQAPFRIYWAYNLSRFDKIITPPPSSFRVPPGANLPPGVFENQIAPQLGILLQPRGVFLREPLKTVRFSISRTF